MIKLNYPTMNERWGNNDLNFQSWEEYWKTLGYLSNPYVHKYNNTNGDLTIKYEHNEESESYSGTPRIYYYGNVNRFLNEFPSLYSIRTSGTGNIAFRINRKEFGETLIEDLGFNIIDIGTRDQLIIPSSEEEIFERISRHSNFNIDAWNEGYNLGALG